MGGRVGVESDGIAGSKFWMELAAAEPTACETQVISASGENPVPELGVRHNLRERTEANAPLGEVNHGRSCGRPGP